MRTLGVLFLLLTIVSCGTHKNGLPKADKSKEVNSYVSQKEFEINNEWAIPTATNSMLLAFNAGLLAPGNNAANIDLTNSANHFRMMKDSVSIYLPFFGESRAISTRLTDASIVFDGIPKEIKQSYNEKKKEHVYNMKVVHKRESYRIKVYLRDDASSYITVSSPRRSFISFKGKVHELGK
jgi:hypothetical protein